MITRVLRAAWLGLAILALAEIVATVLVGRGLAGRPGVQSAPVPYGDLAVDVAIVGAGLLLGLSRPRNAIGALMLTFAVLGATQNLGDAWGIRATVEHRPLADWALSLGASLWVPALFLPVTVLLVIYPDGRVAAPWWRWVNAVAVAGMVLTTVWQATSASQVSDAVAGGRPVVALDPGAGLVLGLTGAGLLVVATGLSIGAALRRLWRAEAPLRQQLLWLLVTATLALVLAFLAPWGWLFDVALATIPVAIAVGVLRYHLLGIDIVVRRTIVYAVLTGAVVGAYAAITTLAGLAVPHGPAPAVAGAATVAVALVPVRDRLQRGVDRLVYGDRRDPLGAVQRLGAHLALPDPMGAVVAALADAVRASYASIVDDRGVVVAQTGDPAARPLLARPLSIGGEVVGELRLAPARGEADLAAPDERVIAALATPVAAVLRAHRLNADLSAARERILTATEAERSRIRRDLHDGLGPSLSGAALGLEAARTCLAGDPARTAEILDRVRDEMRHAVDDVRRIIEALAPAALVDRGLVAAIRDRAATLSAYQGQSLRVEVDIPAQLPPLPASVEVAVFRIIDEAVTNVVRHAGAQRCVVRLAAGDDLTVEVGDDGRWGSGPAAGTGVGLASMRERAESLGGRFEVLRRESGSTVLATLPLAVAV
jgi:signal transduction histidine kinase